MVLWKRRCSALSLGLIGCLALVFSADAAVEFTSAPTVSRADDGMAIQFAVSAPTDVEVAIINGQGRVVRHLAAGVLGADSSTGSGQGNPPPAPLQPGLSQRVVWDGQDDYGETAQGAPFSVRVRAGMGVKLDRIVGGDPYAYQSRLMGQGDHSAFHMSGLVAGDDGLVYVLGNANHYGPPALRAYSVNANYVRTVYPPPAGKPIEEMKGWGLYVKEDGTYSFRYKDFDSPALSTTGLLHTRGDIGALLNWPSPGALVVQGSNRSGKGLFKINVDGTMPSGSGLSGGLVKEPAMADPEKNVWRKQWRLYGPEYICPTPDGKHFYLSGVAAAKLVKTKRRGAYKDCFWRDGQLYKVDVATRTAKVFFSYPADTIPYTEGARRGSPLGERRTAPSVSFQGVDVDRQGRVFVGDRLKARLLVLDHTGKEIGSVAVKNAEAVGVSPKTKAVFLTTRYGDYHRHGKLHLVKINDWTKDTEPAVSIPLSDVGEYPHSSVMTVVEAKGDVYVWVAYSSIGVRVYKETQDGLELVKDFYESGLKQRCLDLHHMVADPEKEHVYFADGNNGCWRITDWDKPVFEHIKGMSGLSLAVDVKNRYLYAHADRQPVRRYSLDERFPAGAPPKDGKENVFTPKLTNDWRIGLQRGDRGIAVAFDGSLAVLNAYGHGDNYGGFLRYFKKGETENGVLFKAFNQVKAGGVRFDSQGNLYAGKIGIKPEDAPAAFRKDRGYLGSTGYIYKFTATGKPGNLFPEDPGKASRVYKVNYGYISPRFSRTPHFGVDGYGRIYYPTSLLPQVSVIDNTGNQIVSFGTWGNRDSMGGLEGDQVPTEGIPMACPYSVDATDRYIYVSDIVNIRLMRLAKTFAAESTMELK